MEVKHRKTSANKVRVAYNSSPSPKAVDEAEANHGILIRMRRYLFSRAVIAEALAPRRVGVSLVLLLSGALLVLFMRSGSVQHFQYSFEKLLAALPDSAGVVRTADISRVKGHGQDAAALAPKFPDQYTPPCLINWKDAVSAINRAKSDDCKKALAELACRMSDLYPKSLSSTCPSTHDPTIQGQHVGCFKDAGKLRTLPDLMVPLKNNNSVDACVRSCQAAGYAFAGVEYSVECFCGDTRPPSRLKASEEQCNRPCPANPNQKCGGYYAINVHQTGLMSPQVLPMEGKYLEWLRGGGSQGDGRQRPRIVYLLTVNSRATRQVSRLIKRLFDGHNYIYLHVDSRSSYTFEEVKKFAAVAPDLIRVSTRRWATIWGGTTLLTMLLGCMEDLMAMRDWSWDYVLNLSEADYPIKPTAQLLDFLQGNLAMNFVRLHGRGADEFIKKQGLGFTFFQCDNHLWRLGSRRFPSGVKVGGGSDWVCLHREFVEFLLSGLSGHSQNFVDNQGKVSELLQGLIRVYNYTLLPAESFFHTVLANSRFCGTVVNNNLHLINWKRHLGCYCQTKEVVDWCGCSPNDFTLADWDRLNGTSVKHIFFARKFEPVVSQTILDKVDHHLLGVPPDTDKNNEVVSNHYYRQNVFHHLHDVEGGVMHMLARIMARMAVKEPKYGQVEKATLEVMEVTSLHEEDEPVGFLVKFHNPAQPGEFEAFVRFQPGMRQKSIRYRQAMFSIGSGYDRKESMFRNAAAGAVVINHGQGSDVSLRYEFNEIRQNLKNFTALWFSPAEDSRPAAVSALNTSVHSHFVHVVKPSFLSENQGISRLVPGVWEIAIVESSLAENSDGEELWALVPFLVLPAEHGKVNIQPNVQIAERDEPYAKKVLERFKSIKKPRVLSSFTEVNEKLNSAIIAGNKTLQADVIEEMANAFFYVASVCRMPSKDTDDEVDCSTTDWSSVAPDIKYTFTRYDIESGALF